MQDKFNCSKFIVQTKIERLGVGGMHTIYSFNFASNFGFRESTLFDHSLLHFPKKEKMGFILLEFLVLPATLGWTSD